MKLHETYGYKWGKVKWMMYTYRNEKTLFVIYCEDRPLRTPMGSAVECHSEEVAKQLCKDLDEFGEEPSNPLSLVAFQYAFIDFFSKLPRQELEESVSSGLDINWDWTFCCPTATPKPLMDWIALFGTHSANAANGKNWLSTLSLTQLCAVSVLGRAIESVNIPFILATSLKPKHLSKFSAEVSKRYGTYSKEKCNTIFNKYLFYYNVCEPVPGNQTGY